VEELVGVSGLFSIFEVQWCVKGILMLSIFPVKDLDVISFLHQLQCSLTLFLSLAE
jgi:hypothetical protein